MTSKERVQTTLAHEEPDRVPAWTFVDPNIRQAVLGRRSGIDHSVRRMAANAEVGGQARKALIEDTAMEIVDLAALVGLDMVDVGQACLLSKVTVLWDDMFMINADVFDVTIEELRDNCWRISCPEDFWCVYEYVPANAIGYVVTDSIKERGIAEFERYIEYLEARVTQSLTKETLEGLGGIRLALDSRKGRDLFLLGYADVVGHPLTMPFYPLFLEAMITRGDLIERYVEVTTEGVMPVLRAQLEMGVDGVMGAVDFCYKTGPIFSPECFERFYAPHLRRIVEECHRYGVPFIKHLDGNTTSLLKILVESVGIDGYHAIEPGAGMDIGRMKREYGDRITLVGNVDCGPTLTLGSQADVRHEVKDVLRTAAAGGGFILSTSNAVHAGVPVENFMAMMAAGREFGRYPILDC